MSTGLGFPTQSTWGLSPLDLWALLPWTGTSLVSLRLPPICPCPPFHAHFNQPQPVPVLSLPFTHPKPRN